MNEEALSEWKNEFRDDLIEDFVDDNEDQFEAYCERRFHDYMDEIQTRNDIVRWLQQ